MNEIIERAARAIASHIGYDYDMAFKSKSEWNECRGYKSGQFHDINEPFQIDYVNAAKGAIDAILQDIVRIAHDGFDCCVKSNDMSDLMNMSIKRDILDLDD